MQASALEAYRARFGAQFSVSAAEREAHAQDESRLDHHLPDAVLYARSEQDVVDALNLARAQRVPVTPFAVGSSLEGQVVPTRGGLSLDVSRMNAVLGIEPGSFQATVQPGVTYPDLNRQAGRHGLFWAVDPGAPASLGGMASTNASGTGAVRYGTTRDNILELRVALMDGRVIRVGSRARKTSAGYDLKHLFIGAEGTLGVITALTVRLWPLPEHLVALRGTFPTVRAAADCAVLIMGAALNPERLELVDGPTLNAVNRYLGTTHPETPTLWIELAAATPTALQDAMNACRELCRDAGAQHILSATAPEERRALWDARHRAFTALSALNPGHARLATDACVPLHHLPDILDFTRARCQARGLDASFVGHVGDGNFHVLFHAPPDDHATWAAIHATYDEMMHATLQAGGTCTGEHGIGLHKQKYLALEHADTLDVMRDLKRLFDPHGLLNPGKILPEA